MVTRNSMASHPNLPASFMGILRKKGIGKNIRTPIRLNRKCAIAILIAPLVLEFSVAAIKAVIVVPTFAPIIKGAACRRSAILFATMGTTTEVVIVLDLIAAVVNIPQPKDFN